MPDRKLRPSVTALVRDAFSDSAEQSLTLMQEREDLDTYREQWGDEVLSSRGVRQNEKKTFGIELTGRQVYALLEFTRDCAGLRAEDYQHLRRCVLLHELLLLRARAAGF